jgi:NADPH2:quinone reductase
MRAILCNAFKGIEALGFTEVDEPRPAANEVLVDVHAASVSYMDYLMSCGGYQMRPALPYVPGTDAAGIVLACGDRVTRFRPGDRVSCGNWFGAFAERMVAKESSVAMLPANVDFTVGSTVMHTYLTAWYALIERARLQAGETVLVTGAAGGVGLACVEIAHLMGARVIAVVGSAAKAALVRTHGAAVCAGDPGQWRRCRHLHQHVLDRMLGPGLRDVIAMGDAVGRLHEHDAAGPQRPVHVLGDGDALVAQHLASVPGRARLV